jgi:hypothetical protein
LWRRRVARSGEVRRGIRSQGVADRERARGAQRGRKGRPEPAIPATSAVRIAAARGRGPLRGRRGAGPESECVLVFPVHMTYRVVQATTTCHQAMANRRPAGPNESRRGQRGQHGDGKGRGRASARALGFEDSAQPTLCLAYALLRRRSAGFGRRERRRRRCGEQRGSSGERGKSPIGVNRGLLGRTRPRRGQRLFTCKRRDAREASLPLRCYAESREGPGLHRQPRPGDRRCVGRPPSASAEAEL